ncbi:hypothetical protein C0993_003161 [Termitomyces sp. T159_Od127]|nr:hypothetical protein C0993_003161 [Termitomyces sp. T159_Od127]
MAELLESGVRLVQVKVIPCVYNVADVEQTKYLETFDPKAMHHILVKPFTTKLAHFMLPIFSGVAKKVRQQRRNQQWYHKEFDQVEHAIKSKLAQGPQEIDVLHWMSRAALEMIGQSGLGYSFDPLVEGATPHPFCGAAQAFSTTVSNLAFEIQYLLPIIVKIGSPRFRRWLVDHFPSRRLRALRDMVDTWDWTTKQILEEKKNALMDGDEALANQIGRAQDLLSILMKANMEASKEDKLPEKEVLGQLMASIRTLIFAATDTTSNALSRILHVLASHPEAQERLRAEVTEARRAHNGEVPYDDLVSLPFLDAVCRETLRL